MTEKISEPTLVPTGIRCDLHGKKIPPIALDDAGSEELVIRYEETCVWIPKDDARNLGVDIPSEIKGHRPRLELYQWSHVYNGNWHQRLCVGTRPKLYCDSLRIVHAIWLMDMLHSCETELRAINRTRGIEAFVTLQFTTIGTCGRTYLVDATMDADPNTSRPIIIPLHYGIPPDDVPKNLIHWSLKSRCVDQVRIGPRPEHGPRTPGFMTMALVPIAV